MTFFNAVKIAMEVIEADLVAGDRELFHPPLEWSKAVVLARALSCRPSTTPYDLIQQHGKVELYRTPGAEGICVNGCAYSPNTLIGALAIELHEMRSETALPEGRTITLPIETFEELKHLACIHAWSRVQKLLSALGPQERS